MFDYIYLDAMSPFKKCPIVGYWVYKIYAKRIFNLALLGVFHA